MIYLAVLLFLLALVLGSLGCGLFLTLQWVACHRQGKVHKSWSRPVAAGWGLLLVGTVLTWRYQFVYNFDWLLGTLAITASCAALLTWPYAMSRYRETVAALAAIPPRYDDPQEGVWPPPPTNTP